MLFLNFFGSCSVVHVCLWLTVTNVVFEFAVCLLIKWQNLWLTVTNVVFEWWALFLYWDDAAGLTVTNVVFEFCYTYSSITSIKRINSNKCCFWILLLIDEGEGDGD